jgi:hypothetical protein
MHILRSVVVSILSLLLFMSLCILAFSVSLDATFGQSTNLSSWLNQNISYKQVIQYVSSELPDSATIDVLGNTTTLSVTQEQVHQALTSAYPSTQFHSDVNQLYSWLQKKTTIPDFRLNLTPAQAAFVQKITSDAIGKVPSLPTCSTGQLLQIEAIHLSSSALCLPSSISDTAIKAQLTSQLTQATSQIHNPIITAQTLAQGKPYYKQLSWLPGIYKLARTIPWIVAAVAFLCILGIVLCTKSRRGFRVIAGIFLVSGGVLLLLRISVSFLITKLQTSVNHLTNGSIEPIQHAIVGTATAVLRSLTTGDAWFGVSYLAIALIIASVCLRYRRGPVQTHNNKAQYVRHHTENSSN